MQYLQPDQNYIDKNQRAIQRKYAKKLQRFENVRRRKITRTKIH